MKWAAVVFFALLFYMVYFYPYSMGYNQKQEAMADNIGIVFTEEGFILPNGCGATIAEEGQVLLWADPTEETANRYFNLALSCIMLLDLELKIEDRRETWGVMADVCRSRHNITKED